MLRKPIVETTEAEYDAMAAGNDKAAFFFIRRRLIAFGSITAASCRNLQCEPRKSRCPLRGFDLLSLSIDDLDQPARYAGKGTRLALGLVGRRQQPPFTGGENMVRTELSKRVVFCMPVLAALLLLGACGGDNGDNGGPTPTSPPPPTATATPAASATQGPTNTATPGGEIPVLSAAKLLIEHNATDEDTGFQGFADGDPWNKLSIAGPDGAPIVTVTPEGGLFDFGLTELFFETSEPANDEVPIEDVLARLVEGSYTYTGDLVDAEPDTLTAILTHDIPAGPELLTPEDDSTGVDPGNTVVSWEPVTEKIDGEPITIVGYEVIVEVDAPVQFPQGFYKPVFDVRLPATATSVKVPPEFMTNDTCYKYEVLAIEESGNQTLSSAVFETGAACERMEPPEGPPSLTQAKILIEHNATDEDTGFQGFADGDPWNELTITGPGGVEIVKVTPAGGLFNFGLTELFYETSEPANDEVPIADVLARLPEGTYTFRGVLVEGGESTLTATLTHDIPDGPELVSPADGADDVDPANAVVSWRPVTTDIDGNPITIVGYQVIVEDAAPPLFPQGFAKPVLSVFLPPSATSVAVPVAFMQGGTDYKFEVLAIEESGNQTLSSAEFATR